MVAARLVEGGTRVLLRRAEQEPSIASVLSKPCRDPIYGWCEWTRLKGTGPSRHQGFESELREAFL